MKVTKIIKAEVNTSCDNNDGNQLIYKTHSRYNLGTPVYVQHGKHSQKKSKKRDLFK